MVVKIICEDVLFCWDLTTVTKSNIYITQILFVYFVIKIKVNTKLGFFFQTWIFFFFNSQLKLNLFKSFVMSIKIFLT